MRTVSSQAGTHLWRNEVPSCLGNNRHVMPCVIMHVLGFCHCESEGKM